jgi:hypothetical protein
MQYDTEGVRRAEVHRVGCWPFEPSLVHCTAGHLSVRLTERHLITSTDTRLGTLQQGAPAKTDADGVQKEGGKRASYLLALRRRLSSANAQAALSARRIDALRVSVAARR